MDQDQRLELLSAYADGELDDEEFETVEKLLKADKEAAFESTQILQMKKFIQRWDGVASSGRVRRAVLEHVGGSRPDSPASGLISFVLGVLAAILVLAGAAFLFQFFGGMDWINNRLYGTAPPPASAPPDGKPPAATPLPPPAPPPATSRKPGPRMPVRRTSAPVVASVPKGTAWLRIEKTTGNVIVAVSGVKANPVTSGPINPGSTVIVTLRARLDAKLPNGGLLRAPKPGKFRVGERAEGLVLMAGTLLVQFPETGNKGETLWVEMDGHRVEIPHSGVRAMIARGNRGALRVGVVRGNVRVYRRGGADQPVKVGAGKSVLIKSDGTVNGPRFYKGKEDFGDFGGLK